MTEQPENAEKIRPAPAAVLLARPDLSHLNWPPFARKHPSVREQSRHACPRALG